MQILTNLNLLGNEIQNFKLHNLASPPSNPNKGTIYFDTAENLMKYYNGTSWTSGSNTTYTFASGTTNGAFNITPSDGSTQTVSIYGLGTAAYKSVDSDFSNLSSINIPTTAAVASYLSSKLTALDVMRYKGTLGTGGDIVSLPTTSNSGDTYKVIVAGTYASQSAIIGDLFIAKMDNPTADTTGWSLIPSGGDDGNVTGSSLTLNTVILGSGGAGIKSLANGTNGQVLKLVSGVPTWSTDSDTTYTAGTGITISSNVINHTNSITAGTASEGGSTRTLTFGGTFNIPSITYDSQGHITAKSSIVLTLPSNPVLSTTAYKYTTTNPALTTSSGVCSWTVTHSLGNQYPMVQIYEVSSGSHVMAEVVGTSTSVCTVSIVSSANITAGTYRITVIG